MMFAVIRIILVFSCLSVSEIGICTSNVNVAFMENEMSCSFRIILSVVSVLGMSSAVFAMGTSTPADYVPDPSLKRASVRQLQSKISNACVVIQNRNNNLPQNKDLRRKCGCYAENTLKSLSDKELLNYRETGVFNRTARRKAYAALEGCNLSKP